LLNAGYVKGIAPDHFLGKVVFRHLHRDIQLSSRDVCHFEMTNVIGCAIRNMNTKWLERLPAEMFSNLYRVHGSLLSTIYAVECWFSSTTGAAIAGKAENRYSLGVDPNRTLPAFDQGG